MKLFVRLAFSLMVAILVAAPPLSAADSPKGTSTTKPDDEPKFTGDPYTLPTCPVDGRKVGLLGKPVVLIHEGRELRFCSRKCIASFNEDPRKYLMRVDQFMATAQLSDYPIDTCLITGRRLAETDEAVNFVYHNRLVRCCSENCPSVLKVEPQRYLAELDQKVIDAQLPKYPLTTCVNCDKPLGKDSLNLVIANRLVRLDAKECQPAVMADPLKALGKIDAARKARQGSGKDAESTGPAQGSGGAPAGGMGDAP